MGIGLGKALPTLGELIFSVGSFLIDPSATKNPKKDLDAATLDDVKSFFKTSRSRLFGKKV